MTCPGHNNHSSEQHRVLIVDDDPLALELLEFTLLQFGYDVATASDGQSALDRMRTFSPRFHYFGCRNAGHVGGRAVSVHSPTAIDSFTYFILLTSNSDPDSVLEGLDAGSRRYL